MVKHRLFGSAEQVSLRDFESLQCFNPLASARINLAAPTHCLIRITKGSHSTKPKESLQGFIYGCVNGYRETLNERTLAAHRVLKTWFMLLYRVTAFILLTAPDTMGRRKHLRHRENNQPCLRKNGFRYAPL